MNKALIILACMLAVPLLAKLPSAKIRAISKAIRAKDVNAFAAVFAEHRLDVNSVLISGGYTVLHVAAAQGSPDIIEYLITQNAEVNVIDDNGHTPLDEAIAFGNADTAALLEAAGATHGKGDIQQPMTADDDFSVSTTNVSASSDVDLLPEFKIDFNYFGELGVYRQRVDANLNDVQKDSLGRGIWSRMY